MRNIPRALLQNRQILGYDVDGFSHLLVLPARRQSIEEQGEDFLCIRAKDSATNSRKRSSPYPLANLIRLPSQLNCHLPFSLRYLERKRHALSRIKNDPLLFFQVVDQLN